MVLWLVVVLVQLSCARKLGLLCRVCGACKKAIEVSTARDNLLCCDAVVDSVWSWDVATTRHDMLCYGAM